MEETFVHPQTEAAADIPVERQAEPCHDLAQVVAQHAPPAPRALTRWSFSLTLVVSIAVHALLLAAAWAFAPVFVQRTLLRPIMLFQEGEQNVGDPSAPAEMPVPLTPDMVVPSTDHPPVELPQADLPDAPPVKIELTEIQPPPPGTEVEDSSRAVIGIASDAPASMNPYFPVSKPGPATGPVTGQTSTEPVVQSAPIRASMYTPPTVARGFAGRRGLRNGLDNRGLPIPDYPAESRRRGEQGLVELEVTVRADGTVEKIRIISDPGFPLLVKAATEALQNARFDPATRDGLPVAGPLIIPFRFTLN